jgi:hypothetical protein
MEVEEKLDMKKKSELRRLDLPPHLGNAEDGPVLCLDLAFRPLLARIEGHEVELRELVELLEVLQPLGIRNFSLLTSSDGSGRPHYRIQRSP